MAPTPPRTINHGPTMNRGPTPFKIDSILVRQRLSLLFTVGNHTAPLEAEPVDGADNEENNQRELKNWYITNEIEHRDIGPGREDQVQCRVGVEVAQSAKPQEVDNHQPAVDQRQHIDQHTPPAQAKGCFNPRPASLAGA